MKKKLLLTSFGTNAALAHLEYFKFVPHIELYLSDMNPNSKIRSLTSNFIPTISAASPNYINDILHKAQNNKIDMIIPGADEEAFKLMKKQSIFESKGIIVAVQPQQHLSILQSKNTVNQLLKKKGFEIPPYRVFRNKESFLKSLDDLRYPEKPLLLKPNSGRGGRGITILTETPFLYPDPLPMVPKNFFLQQIDGSIEYVIMELLRGTIYDVDVLHYQNDEVFFGIRKRINNITNLFSGNIFEHNDSIFELAKNVYNVLPTKYLMDYDVFLGNDGKVSLIEINPRPSGSTVSYIPLGINLYHVLAESYLFGKNISIEIDNLPISVVTYYKMMVDNYQR